MGAGQIPRTNPHWRKVALIARPVLYSFRRCPYAMRARMALLSSGVVCELREVALRSKPAEMLAISPKGTVPVLQLHDGRVLEQSLDIMLWALQRHDPEHWLADTEAQHAEHLALIAECDGPFKAHLDRYKYPNRYDLPDGLEHRAQGSLFLGRLDSTLTRTAYLAGAAWGLPDAAVAPFVRQWAHTDPDWFASPALARLAEAGCKPLKTARGSRASWLGLHLGRPETRPSCGPTPSTHSPSPSEGRPYNLSFTTLLRRLWIPVPAWSWRPS